MLYTADRHGKPLQGEIIAARNCIDVRHTSQHGDNKSRVSELRYVCVMLVPLGDCTSSGTDMKYMGGNN